MTREVLTRKLARIADRLGRIAETLPKTLGEFQADRSRRDLSAFYLAMAIEDSIAVAEHLVAERGWGAPDSASETFRLLSQHGVLTPGLATLMAQAAGMRNAILHQYDELDWGRVYSALNDLSRLREYAVAVEQHGGEAPGAAGPP